jgi:hypothetical protein
MIFEPLTPEEDRLAFDQKIESVPTIGWDGSTLDREHRWYLREQLLATLEVAKQIAQLRVELAKWRTYDKTTPSP